MDLKAEMGSVVDARTIYLDDIRCVLHLSLTFIKG